MKSKLFLVSLSLFFGLQLFSQSKESKIPKGFEPLFNGKDFTNWKIPAGDNGHWKILNGVIDYDAESEAKGDKNLWTEKSYENFVLYVDWRIK